MSVDYRDSRVVRDADMVGLDPNQLAVLLVRGIDAEIAFPLPRLQQEPEV